MKYSSFYQFRKPVVFFILCLLFSGISTGLNTNRDLTWLGVTPALANYGNEERNSGERTFVVYNIRTILELTPRTVTKFFDSIVFNPKVIFKIKGLSSSLSREILYNLHSDTEYTKTLIRDMMNAKTREQKLKVLQRHKRAQEKEIKKLDNKRKIERRKRLTIKSGDEFFSLSMSIIRIKNKIEMINKWAKKLGKKGKKQKTGK